MTRVGWKSLVGDCAATLTRQVQPLAMTRKVGYDKQ